MRNDFKNIRKEKKVARKKKVSGLSVAIVALNIIIVGIIIALIALIYMHMKDDSGTGRGETTTTTAADTAVTTDKPQGSEGTSPSTDVSGTEKVPESSSAETTTIDVTLPMPYTQEYFENDLFIGDSISTGLYLYNYLEKDNVFAEVGLNPESAVSKEIDGATCIDRAAEMNPKRIFIMLGSNGLAFLDGKYMANKLVELIAELEMACPTAKICVISIPPVTKAHESEGNETMEKVNAYNTALKSLCDEGGYTYIDICTLFKDSEGYFADKYAESDGLHFKGNTYTVMLGYIQKTLGD